MESHDSDGHDRGHDHDHASDDHDHKSGHDHAGDDHDHKSGHDHAGDGHGHDHHRHDADSVAVAVVTVSSSRSLDDDPSGDYAVSAVEAAGHEVAARELIGDDYDGVRATVGRLARRADVDAVVTTGGTGVTPDDVTPDAVGELFEKRLPGFGELFRRRSAETIGTRTVGSRATAGVVAGAPVFCLPGSENAVRLGVDEVILPEIEHLVGLAGRGLDEKEGDAASGRTESDTTDES